MFTRQLKEKIELPFRDLLGRMESGDCAEKAVQVANMVRTASEPVAEALKYLYASMPMSDAVDYPVELFGTFARHGAFLYEKGPFAGRVPERLFAGYVLHHRVNNEDLTEHREYFWRELKDRIAGMDMRQAVLEVNYWCASQVTYRATDERTAGPMSVYDCAYGRCGEESTFVVSVLRSLGIPARQVYVPLWSHCDDNHAWVEAWCDGEWVFLGACEPEEVLNRGWFLGASSRAMLVHSKSLFPVEKEGIEEAADQVMTGNDMSHVLNHTGRYAMTVEQEVAVYDKAGKPQPDAMVRFEVMNGAAYGEIASVTTDEKGRCVLRTGLGSIHVTASKDGVYGEALADTRQGACCEITLGVSSRSVDGWDEMTFFAPGDSGRNGLTLSEQEESRGRKRLEEMNCLRREKESRLYDAQLARQVTAGMNAAEGDRCIAVMRKACRNQREIAAFLSEPTEGAFPESWKLAVLESLQEKDYRDITAGVLEESCRGAAAWTGIYEDSLLVPYILCPRVENEMIRPFRRFIRGWLERESARAGRNLAEEIRRDPAAAWCLVKDRIRQDKRVEYGSLVTSAAGALESGYGSRSTQRILCVQILRTLGIPARLDPAEGLPQAWMRSGAALKGGADTALSEADGRFVWLERHGGSGRITISGQRDMEWNYFGNWTLARFDGEAYRTLLPKLWSRENFGIPVSVISGRYRVLTANRLPNGNILAKQFYFELQEGEEREIRLELAQANPSDMLTDFCITDFGLEDEDGEACRISELAKEAGGLFIWLGEDEEPTEHILNEIYQRKEAYAAVKTGLFFVAARPQIRENPACRRLLEALPKIRILFDDFGTDMEALARRLYLEPGKLPLAVLIDRHMRGIYSVAGYNVGTGDMILKLLPLMQVPV
ncbi:MAG: transglutaminase domain-containing protein [Lachnospiraceae bacterium]|nr:transglutaminase domain-containing protein [Lachnospiraceae bacterium]